MSLTHFIKENKMKTFITILVALFFATSLNAQDSSKTKQQTKVKKKVKIEQKTKLKHGLGFVDADGDGYNDNAPDHDGDGIPNGLDEDYMGAGKRGFVDEDGDGINDNARFGKRTKKGKMSEIENKRISPQDGRGKMNNTKGKTSKGKRRRGN